MSDTKAYPWRDRDKEPTLDQAKYMVESRVDGLHVGETFRTVIEEVRSGWRPDFRKDMDPQARRVRGIVYRAAILRHLQNRGLYDSIYGRGMSDLEEAITKRLYLGRRG